MFKVNDKDTRTMLLHRSGVFIVNFEQLNVDWVNSSELLI